MAKDKFKQIQKGEGLSFEDMVKQATTVAAIEKQAEQQSAAPVQENPVQPAPVTPVERVGEGVAQEQRYIRFPNPQIPIAEYNLVSRYCEKFPNMTRQDFVELAIIEKLHNDGDMAQEDFNRRYEEIRNRPTRGHRKGTKNK